jgi:hypothetical protein
LKITVRVSDPRTPENRRQFKHFAGKRRNEHPVEQPEIEL